MQIQHNFQQPPVISKSPVMEQLEIQGGHSLKGSIRISGAKNAALPMLAATLLAQGAFRLRDVPCLEDVNIFIRLLEELGFKCKKEETGILLVDSSGLSSHEAPYELVRMMRASVLVLGPLTARLGRAKVALPGGCAIGARPIDFHLKGLELMGAKLKLREGYVEVRARRLSGARIYFDIPSVTATENLMMAACLASGVTTLENAAREPEVVALGQMLQQMGAHIKGLGSETVKIEGVRQLSPVDWKIIPDRIETGTYLMAVGAAGGKLVLENTVPSHLDAVLEKLKNAGLVIDILDETTIRVKRRGRLKSVDVKTLPYPGFPTDLQAQIMVLMALAGGLSVITETIFENRFMHVAELRRLGADIRIEGRSAIVRGVSSLAGAPVMATDLRASACLVLAGLAAKGKTVVGGLNHLNRGYENMDEKLCSAGAVMKRVKIEETV